MKNLDEIFETKKEKDLFLWAESKIVQGAWNRMESEMLPSYHIAFVEQCKENVGAHRIYKEGLKKIQGR